MSDKIRNSIGVILAIIAFILIVGKAMILGNWDSFGLWVGVIITSTMMILIFRNQLIDWLLILIQLVFIAYTLGFSF